MFKTMKKTVEFVNLDIPEEIPEWILLLTFPSV